MTTYCTDFASIIEAICKQGYAICEDFLPIMAIQTLIAEAQSQGRNGKLTAARIGKQHQILNPSIRGDAIYWLEENDAESGVTIYFEQMHALKQQINRNLFMGLQELEAHFAIYPVGSGYQKHLDQFKSDQLKTSLANLRPRRLSSILYLNNEWRMDDGGELRLYIDDQNHLDILPTGGKLVLFLSGKFWHEVRPAKRERMSVAGWLK